jgi:hypothetical protein
MGQRHALIWLRASAEERRPAAFRRHGKQIPFFCEPFSVSFTLLKLKHSFYFHRGGVYFIVDDALKQGWYLWQ